MLASQSHIFFNKKCTILVDNHLPKIQYCVLESQSHIIFNKKCTILVVIVDNHLPTVRLNFLWTFV